MDFELVNATDHHIDVIKNLMQFYIYDFSEYLDYDVEEDGFYKAYADLDEYRKKGSGNCPYIIMKGKEYVGFILVKEKKPGLEYFSIAEFFIMKKYRRTGIGKAAARQLFTLYKGNWQVHQRENNLPAQEFWRSVINEYTNGDFSEHLKNGRTIQKFRT